MIIIHNTDISIDDEYSFPYYDLFEYLFYYKYKMYSFTKNNRKIIENFIQFLEENRHFFGDKLQKIINEFKVYEEKKISLETLEKNYGSWEEKSKYVRFFLEYKHRENQILQQLN